MGRATWVVILSNRPAPSLGVQRPGSGLSAAGHPVMLADYTGYFITVHAASLTCIFISGTHPRMHVGARGSPRLVILIMSCDNVPHIVLGFIAIVFVPV